VDDAAPVSHPAPAMLRSRVACRLGFLQAARASADTHGVDIHDHRRPDLAAPSLACCVAIVIWWHLAHRWALDHVLGGVPAGGLAAVDFAWKPLGVKTTGCRPSLSRRQGLASWPPDLVGGEVDSTYLRGSATCSTVCWKHIAQAGWSRCLVPPRRLDRTSFAATTAAPSASGCLVARPLDQLGKSGRPPCWARRRARPIMSDALFYPCLDLARLRLVNIHQTGGRFAFAGLARNHR